MDSDALTPDDLNATYEFNTRAHESRFDLFLRWAISCGQGKLQDPGRMFAVCFGAAARSYNEPHHCDLRDGEPADALPIRVFVEPPEVFEV
jgi:hypothetical protein